MPPQNAIATTEDEKALVDLQERILSGTQALQRFTAQERMSMNRKQRLALTLEELGKLPDDTRMYRSTGKAYFLHGKAALVKEAQDATKASDVEIQSIRTQRDIVEKKLKEAETEFRELIQTRGLTGAKDS